MTNGICADEVFLVKTIDRVAREAALAISGFDIRNDPIMDIWIRTFEHDTDSSRSIASIDYTIGDHYVRGAICTD